MLSYLTYETVDKRTLVHGFNMVRFGLDSIQFLDEVLMDDDQKRTGQQCQHNDHQKGQQRLFGRIAIAHIQKNMIDKVDVPRWSNSGPWTRCVTRIGDIENES